MRAMRTPDPDYVPDRDGLRPLREGIARPRLLLLRARLAGLAHYWTRARAWTLGTVISNDGAPEWGAHLLTVCGPDCLGRLGCEGKHEPIFGILAPSSLSAFRRFRNKMRMLYGIPEVPVRRPFVWTDEDRRPA